jgi:hypothetical protein
MTEMVGSASTIGAFRTAEVTALVIILLEVTMGLFIMEALRVTRLFPVIGTLSDIQRHRLAGISFAILLGLAGVEVGMAYMREALVQDQLATSALLRGEQGPGTETGFRWVTTLAQMALGFILPFALMFVAIPLESFIHSFRTLLGMVSTAVLRLTAFLLRWLGSLALHGGNGLRKLYDLVIFLPLWIEERTVGLRDPLAVETTAPAAATAAEPGTPAEAEPQGPAATEPEANAGPEAGSTTAAQTTSPSRGEGDSR